MQNTKCRICLGKKGKAKDNCYDLCEEDNLVVRCGPPWTKYKHKPIIVYSEMITEGMKNKWREINYIDLFAGPGKYYERTTGLLMEGSPLIASKCDYTRIFLNDINPKNIEALKYRIQYNRDRVQYFTGDANVNAKEINTKLSINSLSFCLVDPNNMNDLKFESIKEISRGKRVDLLINFAYGMDFRRSSAKCGESKKLKIDDFFGSDEWRIVNEKYASRDIRFRAEALINIYMSQLFLIGYNKPPDGEEYKNYFPIHNSKNGLLYYLVYASKHYRGYDFCKKMRKSALMQGEFDY